MNSSKWKFIDLFAGIGGMRIPGGLYTLYTTVSSRSAVVDFLGWGFLSSSTGHAHVSRNHTSEPTAGSMEDMLYAIGPLYTARKSR